METQFTPVTALLGGGLIGLAATVLYAGIGRIAGISGIVAGLFGHRGERLGHDIAFVAGLLLGPLTYLVIFGTAPQVVVTASWPLLIVAGLLVGVGTRMGSGCTSGHGISGLARLSPRSFTAVLTFLATAILTVLVMWLGGWL